MPKEKFVTFGELKEGDKFTYTFFGQGEIKFIKTIEKFIAMRLDTEDLCKFHSNDCVKLLLA